MLSFMVLVCTVSNIKIFPQDAAAREEAERNSRTTTITEITTTTSKKKMRSRKDILFDTAFRRQASLHDLHNAGCITEDTVEKLELGILLENEVSHRIRNSCSSIYLYLIQQKYLQIEGEK